MTDNELIRGIRENSPEAWREVYHSNIGRIRAKIEPMFVWTRDRTFHDLYDEALIQMMENVKSGRLTEGEGTNLSGYIYTICWRMAYRWELQSRKMEIMRPASESNPDRKGRDDFPDPGENPFILSPEEYEEAMAFLARVLDAIPTQCRSILRRFYWDRMPLKEVASAVGLKNEDSAKTTKNRCMKKFKDIAKKMLGDDDAAEAAVSRVVERDALRDLLEEFRQEDLGEWAVAAIKDRNSKKDEPK